MIQVKIELVSAITGKTSEIGRMYITNDGAGTAERGGYDVGVCRRGSTEITTPNGGIALPTRAGKVMDYPRLAYNVWRLITRACLAAFPEERPTKPGKSFVSEITPNVMRGLELIRRHLDENGHDWRDGTAMSDVQAAQEWLDAAKADAL